MRLRLPRLLSCCVWFAIAVVLTGVARAETHVRVATYNIKYLKTGLNADRKEKLEKVIDELGADIIGLQEIDDRAALKQLFDTDDWHLIIDDDSGENQDLALAVRKTFDLHNVPADLDAEDEHFLFSGSSNNSAFPDRRDVLCVGVKIPGRAADDPLFIMVHHGKSRFDGRQRSEHRRIAASQAILHKLEHDFDDKDFILLGDFNDNPDDASLNILETGNPNAPGGPESNPGPFLINLTEPLCVAGHVSHGRKSDEVDGDRVDTIDPESRHRNNEMRGTNQNSGDILFDQLLIPPQLLENYAADSAAVFDRAFAAKGNNTTRASDHLPVFADFVFASEGGGGGGTAVRIVGLLPNPAGTDRGHEQVVLQNMGNAAITLTGTWILKDRADNEYELTGTLPAASGANNGRLTITMTEFSMPLNQSGDTVRLLRDGVEVHRVTYPRGDVIEGQMIHFN
jgi:exonuclease III